MKTKLAIALVLVFSLVAPNTASAAPVISQIATCSATVKKSALATVSGQIKALSRGDYGSAFSFASAEFRKNSTIPTFTDVISSSYSYLSTARDVRITDCIKMKPYFYFQVEFVSMGTPFSMTYRLQTQSKSQLIAPNKSGFGISAAQLNESQVTLTDPNSPPKPGGELAA